MPTFPAEVSKISQLDPADNLGLDSLLIISQVELASDPVAYQSRKIEVQDLADTFNLEDLWVDTTGDTMTGDLILVNTEDEDSTEWTHTVGSDGTYTVWATGDFDKTMAIHPGTASLGNTGQLITGRFRYSRPIIEQNSDTVVNSGGSGVTTGMVIVNNKIPVTLQIRALTGSPNDFDVGNFFSVMQRSTGQVTLEGETSAVVLEYPIDRIPATRTQGSVITATYIQNDDGTQYWVISEDLASPILDPMLFGVDNGSVFADTYQTTFEEELDGFIWGDTFTVDYDDVITTTEFTFDSTNYIADPSGPSSGEYAGTLTQGANSWPVLVTYSLF